MCQTGTATSSECATTYRSFSAGIRFFKLAFKHSLHESFLNNNLWRIILPLTLKCVLSGGREGPQGESQDDHVPPEEEPAVLWHQCKVELQLRETVPLARTQADRRSEPRVRRDACAAAARSGSRPDRCRAVRAGTARTLSYSISHLNLYYFGLYNVKNRTKAYSVRNVSLSRLPSRPSFLTTTTRTCELLDGRYLFVIAHVKRLLLTLLRVVHFFTRFVLAHIARSSLTP